MCGIAGIAMARDAPPPDPATLATLAAALRHRGPDGSATTIAGQVGLAHARLAIIDLAGADQPFFASDAALIANGEIYNYRALRAAMPEIAFATAGDCEPPLHLWLQDRDGFAGRLRGMYAIAIHDRASGAVTLSRDPFGIKPLYLARIPGGVAFASEPSALLATGLIPRRIDPEARDELLALQFTSGPRTALAGIERVPPGQTFRIENGEIRPVHATAALPEGGPETIGEAAALARLETALMESVELHQQSDVPYGMFLSGGIDSATLLACMARLNSRPVLAFTAGFDAPGVADEREAAAAVARVAGAQHETITVTQADFWRDLPAIVAAMDDPAADYAIVPTWFLARRARAQVKVVLSGEGGDELLAGYGRYRRAIRPWFLGRRRMRARGALDGLGILRCNADGWRSGFEHAEREAAAPGRSALQQAQAADMADWLPHDLLTKLDRCLMAHGVEGRTPFLDPAVATATFRLPDALKLRNGQGKYLLRTWLATALPAARPFAPKQGFTVPVGAWIAGAGERLGSLVAAQPGIAEIAHPERVRTLFARAESGRAGHAAWILLFYALWHRAHVEGRAPEGSVFDALG